MSENLYPILRGSIIKDAKNPNGLSFYRMSDAPPDWAQDDASQPDYIANKDLAEKLRRVFVNGIEMLDDTHESGPINFVAGPNVGLIVDGNSIILSSLATGEGGDAQAFIDMVKAEYDRAVAAEQELNKKIDEIAQNPSAGTQADWNQSDPTAENYIKNRTHYNISGEEFLGTKELTAEYGYCDVGRLNFSSKNLIVGATVRIESPSFKNLFVEGVIQEGWAYGDKIYWIGNGGYAFDPDLPYTDDDFLVTFWPDRETGNLKISDFVYHIDWIEHETITTSISVTVFYNNIKQLDEQFIPKTFAKLTDLQEAKQELIGQSIYGDTDPITIYEVYDRVIEVDGIANHGIELAQEALDNIEATNNLLNGYSRIDTYVRPGNELGYIEIEYNRPDEVTDEGSDEIKIALTEEETNTIAEQHVTDFKNNSLPNILKPIKEDVENNSVQIGELKEVVKGLSGAMHFRGIVTSDPTIDGFDVSGYTVGDVVIFGNKEFVFSDGKFVEFGDATGNASAITELNEKIDQTKVEIVGDASQGGGDLTLWGLQYLVADTAEYVLDEVANHYATKEQGEKADSALQSVEVGTGLKVTEKAGNKQTISIDEDVIFVLNCNY